MDKELIQMDSNIKDIKNLIFTIRNKQVILDSDIAMLYEVETKRVNEAVKRNIERFPEEFCFRLNEQEYDFLRSQFATASEKLNNKFRNKKYLPYVFTEQGIAMLSAVLHSKKAIEVSINIMKAFVEMRKFIINNQILFEKISNMELKQIEYQRKANEKFDEIFKQIESNKQINQKIFFEKQIYDAFSIIIELIRKANREIILIDNYVDIDTLNILTKKNSDTNVIIYTKKATRLTSKDVNKFNLQYPKLELKFTDKFHDRFLIIDQKYIYHIGASIKDAGKKCFGITLIKYNSIIEDILEKLG
ncbi:MAG: ORF6N domain-containing protein [Clostridia bacterium]|nr:ORF6N domain-containing protein [Clostridia bacterium]